MQTIIVILTAGNLGKKIVLMSLMEYFIPFSCLYGTVHRALTGSLVATSKAHRTRVTRDMRSPVLQGERSVLTNRRIKIITFCLLFSWHSSQYNTIVKPKYSYKPVYILEGERFQLRLALNGNGASFPNKLRAAYIYVQRILSFLCMKHWILRPVKAPQDWFCRLLMTRLRQTILRAFIFRRC